MKRISMAAFLLASAAAILSWRIFAQPQRPLASLMPSGALIYIEAADFSKLLKAWDGSKVKTDWLESANFEVFSRSNLYSKLSDVYDQYSAAAGFAPDLPSVIGMAGGESALALYGIHDVEFLYITRLPQSRLAQTALWKTRSKFEERQSAGSAFYVHEESNRTVAFAFNQGLLLAATREDLIAQSLALLAGGKDSNVAADRWYVDATKAAASQGELRMAFDLEALLKTSYSRAYWIHHSASELKQYTAGIADVARDPQRIVETRTLLRSADTSVKPISDTARMSLAGLAALVPAKAGLYRAWAAPAADFTAALIVRKLLDPEARATVETRYAPRASSTGEAAGTEADLETRIDEPPLAANATGALATAPLTTLLNQAQPQAVLQVQSTAAMNNGFITTPCVIAIAAGSDWDGEAARESLTQAVETLWTTSRLGAHWISGTAGAHAVERLDGRASLMVAVRGRVLYVSNDEALLAAVLDSSAAPGPASQITYSAGFRHARERGNYTRLMGVLDSAQPSNGAGSNGPLFFSQNLASLSGLLAFVNTVSVTATDGGDGVVEQVVYSIGR